MEHAKILVVDDESAILRLLREALTQWGYQVTAASSGAEALQALRGDMFDAVISDIRMPDRNGYEVYAASRRCCPGIPVILMTGFGYDPHHSIVRASQEGLQSVLFKPFEVERMLDEIRKAILAAESGRAR